MPRHSWNRPWRGIKHIKHVGTCQLFDETMLPAYLLLHYPQHGPEHASVPVLAPQVTGSLALDL